MCDTHAPCAVIHPGAGRKKALTLLLLDCWQREYDKRPYNAFRFVRTDFEERMGRRFDLLDLRVLFRFLCVRTHIQSVYLSGICIQTRFCNYECLRDFHRSLTRLTSITLTLMSVPNMFFGILASYATDMQVTELSFEGTPLCTDDIEELRAFLLVSKTISFLNVASCNIDQYNFALLADGIHKSTSLRGFDCSRLVGKGLSLDTEKIAYTLSSLIWQGKLHTIIMEHCEFQGHDMLIIGEYLAKSNSGLLKFNLACNKIASNGAEHLFGYLVRCGMLVYLDISKNSLGTHGGEVVAKYLSSCYYLEYLNITFNEIGADAMNLILMAHKKWNKLLQLKLWGNHFNGKSGMILRRLLESEVVPRDSIDITYTFDDTIMDYRIIPYY